MDNMKNKITLAIGDGANDVNMIQTAHIGVGIFGKEGNQAAAFSDYAVPQFKVLHRLLFWHGRSFGVRFSNFVKWFLWKTSISAIFRFFFNLHNGFSASTPYDDTFYALYDVTCTSLAIWIYFIFD
jgi:P-type E1-E2 ATPase